MSAVFMCSKRFIIIIIIIVIILRFYAVTLSFTLMNNDDRENSQPLCVWEGGRGRGVRSGDYLMR